MVFVDFIMGNCTHVHTRTVHPFINTFTKGTQTESVIHSGNKC